MEDKSYLSEEEQFKKILNKEEINRIKDTELKDIRFKFWKQRYEVVLDTKKTDSQLEEEMEKISKLEQEALDIYRQKHNL